MLPAFFKWLAARRGQNLRQRSLSENLPLLRLELRPRDSGLPDDGMERAGAQLVVEGDGDGHGTLVRPLLHDDVAPALAGLDEAMPGEDGADLTPREPTQPPQC